MKKTASLLFLVSLLLYSCRSFGGSEPAPTASEDYGPARFEELHSPVGSDGNAFLVLGAIPAQRPDRRLSRELAAFSGRWEGFDLGQPVPKDIRSVLVVTHVDSRGGTAVAWAGPDCQSTHDLKRINFAFREDDGIELYYEATMGPSELTGGRTLTGRCSYRYDPVADALVGSLDAAGQRRPLLLKRGDSFITYRDYDRYLAGLGIRPERYEDPLLRSDGDGWLVYLPPEYEVDPSRSWPLIYFFHGSGDAGKDLTVLAKASPFMYIRQGRALPAIVIAPALRDFSKYRSFTPEYLRRVLEKAVSRYRIDRSRVYVTGLSMGGEAAFRFALEYPELVAACAPLCFGDPALNSRLIAHGFKPLPQPYSRAAAIPFLIVQGADDILVPPDAAAATAAAMKAAGLDVTLSILKDRGHDVWNDTYSDPAFYDWLLSR